MYNEDDRYIRYGYREV